MTKHATTVLMLAQFGYADRDKVVWQVPLKKKR